MGKIRVFIFIFILILTQGNLIYAEEQGSVETDQPVTKTVLISQNIEGGQPVSPGNIFCKDACQLDLFVESGNAEDLKSLKFIWYKNNRWVHSQKKHILLGKKYYMGICRISNSAAPWRVDIYNDRKKKIYQVNYIIKDTLREKSKPIYEKYYEVFSAFNIHRDFPSMPIDYFVPHMGPYQNNAMLTYYFHQKWHYSKMRINHLKFYCSISQMSVWSIGEVSYVDSNPHHFDYNEDEWEYIGVKETEELGPVHVWEKNAINIFYGGQYAWQISSFFGMYAKIGGFLHNYSGHQEDYYDGDLGIILKIGPDFTMRASLLLHLKMIYFQPFNLLKHDIINIVAELRVIKLTVFSEIMVNNESACFTAGITYELSDKFSANLAYVDHSDPADLTESFGFGLSYYWR